MNELVGPQQYSFFGPAPIINSNWDYAAFVYLSVSPIIYLWILGIAYQKLVEPERFEKNVRWFFFCQALGILGFYFRDKL